VEERQFAQAIIDAFPSGILPADVIEMEMRCGDYGGAAYTVFASAIDAAEPIERSLVLRAIEMWPGSFGSGALQVEYAERSQGPSRAT